MKRITPEQKAETLAKQSEGLGDTVHKITATVGIAACEKCVKRGKGLNKLFPYKKKNKLT